MLSCAKCVSSDQLLFAVEGWSCCKHWRHWTVMQSKQDSCKELVQQRDTEEHSVGDLCHIYHMTPAVHSYLLLKV
jgi:hypothetical protein